MQNKVTLFCKVTVKTTDRQQERRFFLHFFRFRKAVIFSKTERKVTGLPACNFLTNSMGIHYLCTRIPTKRPAVFRRGRRPEREHQGGAGKEPGRAKAKREATGNQTGGADRKDRKAAGEGLPGEPGRAEAKRKATGSQTGPLKERRETSGNNGTPSGDDETPSGNAGGGSSAPGSGITNEQNHTKKIRL